MNRGRENRLILTFAGLCLVLAAAFFLFRPGGVAPVVPLLAPTATPVVSAEAQAESAALLDAAVLQRSQGQIDAALDLGDQAVAKWPQSDAAARFLLTVVPQGTAVAQRAQARSTAAAQAALTEAQAGAVARRVYGTSAGLWLQRYADALGSFYQKNREARDQPALVQDPAWRLRTATDLRTMENAATALTTLAPLPPDMAVSSALFNQIAVETAQFDREYAGGLEDAPLSTVPFASTRTDHVMDLLRQANYEVRRSAPSA
jgi:hypothetical protein